MAVSGGRIVRWSPYADGRRCVIPLSGQHLPSDEAKCKSRRISVQKVRWRQVI